MRHIAHRGYIDQENTIDSIVTSSNYFDAVEIDVRYNSNRDIVLCHDREKRNESNERFVDLCKQKAPMHLLVDIKAFGIDTAKQLAKDIVFCIQPYTHHTFELCSFNEYCVQELLDLRTCSRNYVLPFTYNVGVITSGLPVGIFGHLYTIDFISFNYDTVHEEIFEKLKDRNYKVYAWVCNDPVVRHDMEHRYGVDAIIYDVQSSYNSARIQ